MLTYYITIIILLGYFIYSRLIFYLVFFITFCPCISYVLLFDNPNAINQRKKDKLKEKLKECTYKEYVEKHNLKLDNCIICTMEFTDGDKVIELACNSKHCYHAECITKWVEKRSVCPLC